MNKYKRRGLKPVSRTFLTGIFVGRALVVHIVKFTVYAALAGATVLALMLQYIHFISR